MNFGKRGIGLSAGVPGLRVGVDSRGKEGSQADTQKADVNPAAVIVLVIVACVVVLLIASNWR